MIGVNAQIQSDSGGSDGVGFAIPSNTVRSVVSQIVAGKTVEHAYFGVQVEDSSSPGRRLASRASPRAPRRRAPASACGDVVTKLDGTTIASQSDLSNVIEAKKPGDKIKVTYVRGTASRTPSSSRSAPGRARANNSCYAKEHEMSLSRKQKVVAGGIAALAVAGGGAAIGAEFDASARSSRSSRRGEQLGDSRRVEALKGEDSGRRGRPAAGQADKFKAAIGPGQAPVVGGGFGRVRGRRPPRRLRRARRRGDLPRGSQAELQATSSGKTLASVAKAQGKTAGGLVSAMVAAAKTKLAAAVTAGNLTQGQEQSIESSLEQRITGPRQRHLRRLRRRPRVPRRLRRPAAGRSF